MIAPALIAAITLALMLLGAGLGQPGFAISAADPASGRVLSRFYEAEQNPTDTFRWSEPRFSIFLDGFAGRSALVSLRLTAPRPEGAPPVALALRSGSADLGGFTVGAGWRRYQVLAPTDPAGETALLLESTPYQPPGDERTLGVALSELQARPGPPGGAGLPARDLYLFSIPLLAWLLLTRLGARPAIAIGAGLIAALVPAWAAANPTLAAYWLPTLGWPWWPTLPLGLLIALPWLDRGLRALQPLLVERPALGWAGLAVALAALVGLRLGLPAAAGLAGLVGGVGVWLLASGQKAEGERQHPGHEEAYGLIATPPGHTGLPRYAPSSANVASILLGITAVALLLRVINLDGQPAGLWRDESRHAWLALRIWDDPSFRPVYVVEGADLPALLFYLMAPVVSLFGPHAWSARLVSALAGALTPLALYWAAAPLVGRRAALVGAALVAWASWSLSMSRWAFPATLDHLLVLTAVGALLRAIGRPRALPLFALAGLCAGLATYAYHTGRMAPIALAAITLAWLGRDRRAWRAALPGLIVAALVGALTITPLVRYILSDPEGYNRRVGTVSIVDSGDLDTRKPLALVLRNVERYALMWHVRGEPNGRHHLPRVPMLDPIAGLLLAMGLGLGLRAAWGDRRARALLLLWGVYFVPGVFSTDAPHAMRSLGTLAPACMLAGVGLVSMQKVNGRGQTAARRAADPPRRTLGAGLLPSVPPLLRGNVALVGLALGASLLVNSWVYFGVMRADPEVYGEFDLVETAIGRVVQAAAASPDPALHDLPIATSNELARTDTVRYLTYGLGIGRFEEGQLPPGGPALILLPADAPAWQREEALAALGPGADALQPAITFPGTDRPVLLAYGRGREAQAALDLITR